MKLINIFFISAICIMPHMVWGAAPLSGTSGSNLTAFNGSPGNLNNNSWNQLMNADVRTPVADFGNCNALILRCAQPKCANGGCISMDIAYPIVYGCVMANATCKGHGEPLIQTIAAQLVANATARANADANAANANAAAIASQQSDAQMQQMQSQMQQIQQQNAESTATLQAALSEQRKISEQQARDNAESAAATAAANAPTQQIANAANSGVSADVLAREQASGQILTQLENADVALKSLRKTMQNVFDYAGCDASGNNCTGPKRVKMFKQKAAGFFEPYETVLDEVYDALIMAQSLGVDITDIYMMLNGTCNVWGKYLCGAGQTMHYTNDTCESNRSKRYQGTGVRGDAKCTVGQVIPMNDGGCQLIQMLTSNEEVQQNWLYPEQGSGGADVRVGCASEALDNSMLFRGRKKQASIDIEVLQRIIEQDAPPSIGRGKKAQDMTKFCAVDDIGIQNLQRAVTLKNLPASVCITQKELDNREYGQLDVTVAAVMAAKCDPYKEYNSESECKSAVIGQSACYFVSPSRTWRLNCTSAINNITISDWAKAGKPAFVAIPKDGEKTIELKP